MPLIHKTDDYRQFKRMISNRQIDQKHLQSLVGSIEMRNLLHVSPIIVNEKMEVIDGQHRLLAAEQLSTEIFYIKVPGLTIHDVQLLNTNVHSWSIEDYVQSYVSQDNEEYKYLVNFIQKHRLSISMGAAILSIQEGNRSFRASYKLIRSGKFVVGDKDLSDDFIKFYKAVSKYTEENTFRDRDFARAFYLLYRNEEMPVEDFMEKMKTYDRPLFRRAGVQEYLDQFENVYNRGGIKVRLY